ncbi:hypothetical protein BVRB_9g209640 [Beta vulgaris subsp. vulgaris]|nr:hypothetical protein BVRB_9g209640 [Beta vulgaris subsp. vulgaris]
MESNTASKEEYPFIEVTWDTDQEGTCCKKKSLFFG